MPSFLLVKLADMGDVLTATPALRALHETYPDAAIDVLTGPAGAAVLKGNPLVDRLVVADRHVLDSPAAMASPRTLTMAASLVRRLRRRHYDAAFFMHHLTTPFGALKWRLLAAALRADTIAGLDNGRGGFFDLRVADNGFGAVHEVEYCLALVACAGAASHDTSLDLRVPPAAEERAAALLADVGTPLVAMHPGSGAFGIARRWPPERFAALADALAERYGARVALVGGPDDGVALVRSLMHRPAVDLSGRTDLMTLAAVLRRCRLFIGNDGGVMHLATAAGAPLVAIFGPSNAAAWGPWRPSGTPPAVVVGAPCPRGGPCLYTGHSLGSRDGCPTRECLTELHPDEVVRVVERFGLL